MLSLLAHRAGLRAPALISSGVVRSRAPLAVSNTIARTFLTTPRVAYPAVKTAETVTKSAAEKKSTDKKPAAKKAAAKKPAKKVVKVAAKKKVKAEAPKKFKLSPEDKPPKRPPTSFMLFYVQYLKGLSATPGSAAECCELTKQAAQAWRSLTEQERKPYKDAYHAELIKYAQARKEYFSRVPAATLKEINKQRVNKGKLRIRGKSARSPRGWSSSYFVFMRDVRDDFMKTYTPPPNPSKNGMADICRALGQKWRSLSEAEKDVYREISQKEIAAAKAST